MSVKTNYSLPRVIHSEIDEVITILDHFSCGQYYNKTLDLECEKCGLSLCDDCINTCSACGLKFCLDCYESENNNVCYDCYLSNLNS